MKNIFLVCIFLFSTFSFGQSKKNKKRNFKVQKNAHDSHEVSVLKDTLLVKESVFFNIKDTLSYIPELKVPILNISNDLSVYTKDSKKKSKKSNRDSNSLLLQQMQMQQQMMYNQQQINQMQQQAQRVMQQNMMNMR